MKYTKNNIQGIIFYHSPNRDGDHTNKRYIIDCYNKLTKKYGDAIKCSWSQNEIIDALNKGEINS